jgi:hypothetical protein
MLLRPKVFTRIFLGDSDTVLWEFTALGTFTAVPLVLVYAVTANYSVEFLQEFLQLPIEHKKFFLSVPSWKEDCSYILWGDMKRTACFSPSEFGN